MPNFTKKTTTPSLSLTITIAWLLKAATHETPTPTNKELQVLSKNQHPEHTPLPESAWSIYDHAFRPKDISKWLESAAGELHPAADVATLQIEYHTRFLTLPNLEPWAWAEYMVRTDQYRCHISSARYFMEYPTSGQLNRWAQSMRVEGRSLTWFPAVGALGKILPQTIKEAPEVLEKHSQTPNDPAPLTTGQSAFLPDPTTEETPIPTAEPEVNQETDNSSPETNTAESESTPETTNPTPFTNNTDLAPLDYSIANAQITLILQMVFNFREEHSEDMKKRDDQQAELINQIPTLQTTIQQLIRSCSGTVNHSPAS